MKNLQKMAALAALCLLLASTAWAQMNNRKKALQSPADLQKKWFTVDDDSMRFKFSVALEKGELMTVRLHKLSDWDAMNDFRNAFAAATKVMNLYRDSLLQEQNTQVLDIYIPPSQKNIISRFRQSSESGNMMTVNDDGASALKLGMDTLRIVQSKPDAAKVQYTFLLKRLANYNDYAKDESWMNKSIAALDSVVTAYRNKKKRRNYFEGGTTVSISPFQSQAVTVTSPGRHDLLIGEGGVGVSLVRGALCPNYEFGLGVYLERSHEINTFVRLSYSGFYRFAETAADKYTPYRTNFVNLEFGSEANRQKPGSVFFRTSIGFGYKLLNKHVEDRDPTMDNQMYRFFINYSINKYLSVTPERVTNFRKGDRLNSWFGLSVNLHIF